MAYRYVLKQTRDFIVHRILRLDDTPHRIALGVAIGIFVTWTPTIGLQMMIVLTLSTLFRANKAVGVPLVWISNPFTIVPIYGPNYLLGMVLLSLFGGRYSWEDFLAAVDKALQPQNSWWGNIENWFEALGAVFWPLWTGSIIIGLVLGALCYVLTYYGVIAYRRRFPQHDPALRTKEPQPQTGDGAATDD